MNFNELFDGFEDMINDVMGFDRRHFRYNRPIYDQKPYTIEHKDNKDIVVLNVVGMGKDDIEITTEAYNDDLTFLHVAGKLKDKEIITEKYDLDFNMVYEKSKVDKIENKLKNGLLYITITYKKPRRKKLEINYEE